VSRAQKMPRPKSERESWKEELAGLPDKIANHQRELAATPVGDKERRENLLWRIRRDQLRILELEKKLKKLRTDDGECPKRSGARSTEAADCPRIPRADQRGPRASRPSGRVGDGAWRLSSPPTRTSIPAPNRSNTSHAKKVSAAQIPPCHIV
jgi:hypothetical protein